MFDIGFSEIALIAIVALLVTDPKDLPDMMFKAGRFFRQFKIIMSRVTDTVSDVMHELEVESYRKQFKDEKHLIDDDKEADQYIDHVGYSEQNDITSLPKPSVTPVPDTTPKPEPKDE